ncbi:MAG: NnrS family protein [Acidobacteria bacterium]|nr:NnrS family protein [Acidobacteriota bacterium]
MPAVSFVPVPALRPRAPRRERPFFIAGIAVVLTLGVGWGAWLLWRIGFAGSFTGVGVHAINAHGLAQISGWVGLFIMGFAYQFFPRMWRVQLPAPWLIPCVFGLQVAGTVLASTALGLAGSWGPARDAALAGNALLVAAAAIFAGQVFATFRRSGAGWQPWSAFVLAAALWFVIAAIGAAAHAWFTMGAATGEELLALVATYQAPLRDVQIHGLALFMILGVSQKVLPSLLGAPPTPERNGWVALAVLSASVVLEAAVFLLFRWTGDHRFAPLLLLAWIGLPVGAALVAGPWKLWRRPADPDRTGKFFRAAYGWLFLSLAMLLLLPVYQAASGIPFSHAYYGAARHAITVGFVSLMIMGMAARFSAALAGVERFGLPSLLGPFLLVNAGCALRVGLQVLTDWWSGAFLLVGISSLLEFAGLAWWGAHVLALLLRRHRAAA